jgi:hypothetical protein
MMLALVVIDYLPMNVVYLTMNYLHSSLMYHVNDAIDDIDARRSDYVDEN